MYRIWNIYVLAAFGTVGGALFGFDISSMSAWIGSDQYLNYFNSPGSTLQGGITASMSAGSFVGAIAAGWISDHWGRKGALWVASAIWIIGAAVQCSSQNVGHLIAGRVVSGLAIGITSSQVCVFLAELAPSRIRGGIVGIQQWAIEWGIFIMYLISYGCSVTVKGPAAFRIAWGVQGILGVILGGALFFFPESPRWLASKERWEECLYVLANLHAKGDENDPIVLAELEEVKEAARIAALSKKVSIWGLFGPQMWKRTVCGMSVQMWQQLLGGNVMLYYLVYIFNMSGMSGNTALTSSIIQYAIFVITTGSILPFIDRLGRRFLLLSGAAICGILHFATGAVMATKGHHVPEVDNNPILTWEISGAPAKGVIAMAYIFVGIYGFTWAPGAWIYVSEIFPLKYRAKGVGVSASVNWIFNLALALFVPPAFTNIDWKTYMIFGTFCTVMFIHVFFTYPETKRRSLEEIELVFEGDIRPWRSTSYGGAFEDRIEEARRRRSSQPGHGGDADFLRGDEEDGGRRSRGDSAVTKEEHSHHETA